MNMKKYNKILKINLKLKKKINNLLINYSKIMNKKYKN